jgi:hypothetical protein
MRVQSRTKIPSMRRPKLDDETNPIFAMSSIKQIEANRRNALKSTGPATLEGKERSRCNAVRHGLTAETVVGAFEDEADYESFQATVMSDYDPESAVERELVLRLASVLWRLRRASGIETALFDRIFSAKTDIAEGFLYLSALPTFPLDRLSRYEHTLWRQARQLVLTLEHMRRRGRKSYRSRFTDIFRSAHQHSSA